MTNVTLAIDQDLLRRARIRALEQGTSVNAVVREFLEVYANQGRSTDTIRSFLEIADRSDAGSESGERSWTRHEIYEG